VAGAKRLRRRTAATALLLLLAATAAQARTVTVRWRWPNTDPARKIAGFKLYTRHADRDYGAGLDVGLPPEVGGVYSYTLEVSDTDATWVSATAYDAEGRESARSNEKLFLLPEAEAPGAKPGTR
jgi:hypothetical protein